MQGHLEDFLASRVLPGDRVLVAFSGGPDSTALLQATAAAALTLGFTVSAAHLDHALDADSQRRAATAGALARRLSVPLDVQRRDVAALRRAGESLEEAARRVRYAFLEEAATARGAHWIFTAHHRDDQAETVVLRLRQGSGLDGLAGIRAQRGRLLRPLLEIPRAALVAACARTGLEPCDDPTNRDTGRARAFVRHRLLPALAQGDPDLPARLARVATAAARALPAVERRLAAALRPDLAGAAVLLDRQRLRSLPGAARPAALSYLSRLVGARHAPSARAQVEFWRQLEAGGKVGSDCGDGWRWRGDGATLTLERAAVPMPPFTYTFAVPGHCEIPEIGRRLTLRRAALEDWMLVGDARRAGLAGDLAPGNTVEVRNRRPGDRVHPLGAPGERKLKEVLVDRRVPRAERDRLPLLCVGGRIAWIPGVTIDERFRLPANGVVWLAQLEEL